MDDRKPSSAAHRILLLVVPVNSTVTESSRASFSQPLRKAGPSEQRTDFFVGTEGAARTWQLNARRESQRSTR